MSFRDWAYVTITYERPSVRVWSLLQVIDYVTMHHPRRNEADPLVRPMKYPVKG